MCKGSTRLLACLCPILICAAHCAPWLLLQATPIACPALRTHTLRQAQRSARPGELTIPAAVQLCPCSVPLGSLVQLGPSGFACHMLAQSRRLSQ